MTARAGSGIHALALNTVVVTARAGPRSEATLIPGFCDALRDAVQHWTGGDGPAGVDVSPGDGEVVVVVAGYPLVLATVG